jgi:2-(1,2-epoxy-1,2-dihydrophenyl)acetyl-CoA isomerase
MSAIDTGTDELLCGLTEGVATLTLNRPAKRNALSDRLTPALRSMLLSLEADPDVRVVVITGAGAGFCAGGDVSEMGSGQSDEPPPTMQDAVRKLQHRQDTLTLRLHQLSKPTIASLPGPAVGAGMCIALACDLRIAADAAFLATGYARVGLPGDYGGSWLLTELVGPARTKELYFTGRRLGAAEALTLGVVNEVVPAAKLASRTAEWARNIASGPPIAVRYMKENINRAMTADLQTCLDMEAERLVQCARTDDHTEAVNAFLAKRPPNFVGR